VRDRIITTILVTLVAMACVLFLRAQDAGSPPKEQNQEGSAVPDFSGVWIQVGNVTFDPADPQGKNAANLPFTPWAQAKFNAAKPAHGVNQNLPGISNDPINKCFQPGAPRVYLQPYPIEIVQTPGRVVMLFEYGQLFREIYTDGRAHPKDEDLRPMSMGHSIGHWEGNALVVDAVGFTDKTWLDRTGHPHSDELHLTERFTRVDKDTLQDDLTFEDPKAYTKPWTGRKIFKLRPTWSLDESACEDSLSFEDYMKKTIAKPGK
jgi:hypothetical protein